MTKVLKIGKGFTVEGFSSIVFTYKTHPSLEFFFNREIGKEAELCFAKRLYVSLYANGEYVQDVLVEQSVSKQDLNGGSMFTKFFQERSEQEKTLNEKAFEDKNNEDLTNLKQNIKLYFTKIKSDKKFIPKLLNRIEKLNALINEVDYGLKCLVTAREEIENGALKNKTAVENKVVNFVVGQIKEV